MTGYAYLHFFNIQYWYCVAISLFGNRCADVELGIASGLASTTGGVSAQIGDHVGNASQTVSQPGFWDWLFGTYTLGGMGLIGGIFGPIITVISAVFSGIWAFYSALAYSASFLLLLLILGSLGGILLIRFKGEERYGNLPPAVEKPHPLRARWQELLEDTMSADPKRWREGILGADKLLGELFAKFGYEGQGTGEQIRRIPDGAFANLPSAWEAHRIRNFVSSPTSHFILTQHEAFRVMKLYERVFKEFDFI